MQVRIENKPAFSMFGKERIIQTTDERNFVEIPEFWDMCFEDGTIDSITLASGLPIDDDYVGLLATHAVMCYKETEKDTFPYMIAAMKTKDSKSDGFQELLIPAHQWAIFTTPLYTDETLVDAIQTVWKKIFTDWFPTAPYKHADAPELEVYYAAEGPQGYCEIWIPIVNK